VDLSSCALRGENLGDAPAVSASGYAAWLVWGTLAAAAVLSTWYLGVELSAGTAWTKLGLLCGTLSLAAVVAAGGFIGRGLSPLLRDLVLAGPTRWLPAVLVGGLLLRLLWGIILDIPQRSDGATYFTLAERLYTEGLYRDDRGDLAFWPPGYPFFLLTYFVVFGVKPWVPLLGNLTLFVVCTVVVYHLARLVLDEAAARLAALLLAVWPNYVFSVGLASKEMLLTALFPAAILLYLNGLRGPTPWRDRLSFLGSGALLGLSSLAQPSVVLFPIALAAHLALRREQLLRAAVVLALLACGMLAAILPWTVRNISALGAPVLISTNGGDVFYRANNPLATGGYIPRGERNLRPLGEIERNRAGYQWGGEWILAHPDRFLTLAIRKAVLFLGDDSTGAYETLKRDRGTTASYAALKGLSNLYWLGIWTLILWGLWRRSPQRWNLDVLLLGLPVLYLLGIDSIYEGGGRHHAPVMGFIAVVAAGLVSRDSNAWPLEAPPAGG
jgi:4-amino-4-deoxy-L-arabinose transferase-like glycosyltransferase